MLAAAIRAGRVKPIAGLPERMTKYEADVAEVEAKPWLRSEQRRVIGELGTQLRQDINALIVDARKTRLHDLDQKAGQLRARARAVGADASEAEIRSQVVRSTRATMLAAQADRAITTAAANAVWEEALLSQDADIIKLTGFAVQKRLHEIAGKDVSGLRDAASLFDATFSAWRKANPSAVEELAEIERQRDVEGQLFNASVEFALGLYGVAREPATPQLREVPAIEPAGNGMQVAPGFDRLRNLAPLTGARR
jgi:hypothetical protein